MYVHTPEAADQAHAKSFHNYSTILPHFFTSAASIGKNCRTIKEVYGAFQLFYNSSPATTTFEVTSVYHIKETKILRGFWGRVVEGLVNAKFGEGFSLLHLTTISRKKAGKCAWGRIVE
jgi:hypothetical protein